MKTMNRVAREILRRIRARADYVATTILFDIRCFGIGCRAGRILRRARRDIKRSGSGERIVEGVRKKIEEMKKTTKTRTNVRVFLLWSDTKKGGKQNACRKKSDLCPPIAMTIGL